MRVDIYSRPSEASAAKQSKSSIVQVDELLGRPYLGGLQMAEDDPTTV